MKKNVFILMLLLCANRLAAQSWTADNGNGTFTNPLFFEEFSDPCMVRAGNDFYMTGTTMHCMPGLPILHSRDLVNWRLISYVFDRFNLGPEFSFQEGKEMYGQGIWAPSFVYADSTFYIFANVNHHATQVYKSHNPYGPWEHWEMKSSFHDLSVFFDEDGKKYVCWGAMQNYLAQLNDDLTDTIPGTSRMIAQSKAEGAHMYKVNGQYLIIWAVPGNNTPQLAGKAKNIYGPYEIDTICNKNHMGVHEGHGLKKSPWKGDDTFEYWSQNFENGVALHQGGIIQAPNGEWWGYSMQDHSALGRVTCLSPVTWKNGFPYFGLPGNLGKTPKTWVKPNVGLPDQPIVPIANHSDDFASDRMQIIWQWNHLPVDSAWSLTECPGRLRLHALPARGFWHARNTLTQRIVGLETAYCVDIEGQGMQAGDVAGLALLNYPFAGIGISKAGNGYQIRMFDQTKPDRHDVVNVKSPIVRFYVHTNLETEKAQFYYSTGSDTTRQALGEPFTMVFQLKTFQGVRIALFNYNEKNVDGGFADFDNFTVKEQYPHGFRRAIPYGQQISIRSRNLGKFITVNGNKVFQVVDMGLGRVALKCDKGYISIDKTGKPSLKTDIIPGASESFQWTELEYGHLVLLSLRTNRYIQMEKNGKLNANKDIPSPNQNDGTRFRFELAK